MPLYPQGGGLYPNSIDNVLLADMAANTVKGRAAGTGTGDPQDLPMSSLIAASQGLSYRNILGRNGGFEVWQRGAGGAPAQMAMPSTAGYTADGWYYACSAGQNSNVYQWAGVSGFGLAPGSRWAVVLQRTDGQTGVAAISYEYPLDTDEIATARGNFVTLSFSTLASATFSPVGKNVRVRLFIGSGSPARRSAGAYTGEQVIIDTTVAVSVTPTVTRFTMTSTIVVPNNTTQASVYFDWVPVGTASSDYWALDDVQLEVGSVATPFERRPFESELLACKRHYQKTFNYPVAPVAQLGNTLGHIQYNTVVPGGSGALAMLPYRFPISMRAAPTVTPISIGASGNQIYDLIANLPFTGTTVVYTSQESTMIYGVIPGTPGVNTQVGVHLTADAGI
jgi:hypothetical protein